MPETPPIENPEVTGKDSVANQVMEKTPREKASGGKDISPAAKKDEEKLDIPQAKEKPKESKRHKDKIKSKIRRQGKKKKKKDRKRNEEKEKPAKLQTEKEAAKKT
jgi:hypothetical protein